jgi:GNAT superfamily N-acetyltransferase
MTPEVAERIENCCVAFWTEKVEVLRTLPNDPYSAHIHQFGGATALLTAKTDNLDFNRVGNIGEGDLSHLEAISSWYRDYGQRCRFEIIPTRARPALLQGLAKIGYYQTGFYSVLYGVPRPSLLHQSSLSVRNVSLEERDLFAEIYLESFAIPRLSRLSYLRESIRLLVGRPSMQCLFAMNNGVPVAIAILYLHKGVGYLATAATLPTARRCGYHKTLLQARIELAAAAGCDLIAAQTGVATQSQYNMERSGLRIAFTKAFWTLREGW